VNTPSAPPHGSNFFKKKTPQASICDPRNGDPSPVETPSNIPLHGGQKLCEGLS
jgi:hypothetical protein